MVAALLWFLASAIFVDLAGYWLHRWAHKPSSPLYRAHMTHHVTNYPPKDFFSEKYRESGSDGLALWFAPFGIIYVLVAALCGLPCFSAIVLGGAAIAVLSSILHDLSHISDSIVWRLPWTRLAAEHHRVHHSRMGRNFGILFTLWDRIFGTKRRGPSSPPTRRP